MELNDKLTFDTYVKTNINDHNLDVTTINDELKKHNYGNIDKFTANKRLKDKQLLLLSKLIHRPFSELYWYNLSITDRKQVNPKASLSLISKMIELNIKKSIKNENLLKILHVNHNRYYGWRKLRQPIDNYTIKHLAHIYQIPANDLLDLNIIKDNKIKTKNKDPRHTINIHMNTSSPSNLVTNLKHRIGDGHKYRTISDIINDSIMSSNLIYQKDNPDLKYAKRIASYLDMNLEYLLRHHGQTDSQNKLYDTVRHYANQHGITFTQFERCSHIPYGTIKRSIKSRYLNGIVDIANRLSANIDDLIQKQPHKFEVLENQDIGQLSIQLAEPSTNIHDSPYSNPSHKIHSYDNLSDKQKSIINNIIQAWASKM